MRRSIFPTILVLAAGSTLAFVSGWGCGGGNSSTKPAGAGTAESSGGDPKVVIEDSTEVWYEEESGSKPGEKGSKIREHYTDVTKEDAIKNSSNDAGPSKIKVYRVFVRFPVPKVQPPDSRDVHAINRLLWEV